MKLRFLARIWVILVSSFAYAQNSAPQTTSAPLPFELAYSHKQLRRSDRPMVSPDRRWLAYEVFAPPARSPESESKAGRFLPNGTPSDTVGVFIEIVPTSGGPSQAVCRVGATCWRPSWSPNGRTLAFYSDQDGIPQLWAYDLQKKQSRRVSQSAIKAKLWSMDRPVWSPDGSEIFVPVVPTSNQKKASSAAAVSKGGPTVSVYRSTPKPATAESVTSPTGLPDAALMDFLIKENNATLAAIDLASGKTRVVVPAESEPRPSSLKLSPDGKWISYLSVYRLKGTGQTETYYDLLLVPAEGGTPIMVESDLETTDRDYYDEPYLWTPDSKHIVFTKSKHLWSVDIDGKGASRSRALAADTVTELNDYPFVLTADGRSVLVGLKPIEEQGYYSPKSSRFAVVPVDGSVPILFEANGVPVTSNSSTLWQRDPAHIDFVSDESESDKAIVEIEPTTGASRTLWHGRSRLSPLGTDADGRLIVRLENALTPPDYFRFRQDLSALDRLTEIEPQLSRLALGPTESFDVTIPYFDGRLKKVRPSIFLPAGYKKGSPLPALVYFYAGSAFSDNALDFGGGAPNSIPVQLFATRGYAVLFVDVPLGPQGTAGNPIQEMTDAILPQVYRAAELGYIDIRRIAIMGQSYGAYSTMAIATQTNLFRAAVALDGVYDLPGGYARMYPDGGAVNFLWSESGQGRMGTHPWGDLKRYLANSPYYLADKIHTPVLLIHGERDDACPLDEAKKMFNALKRLDRSVELAVYAGEGHVPGQWSLVNAVDVSKRMLDFLAVHLQTN